VDFSTKELPHADADDVASRTMTTFDIDSLKCSRATSRIRLARVVFPEHGYPVRMRQGIATRTWSF
jgi:hypothetical protein